MPPDTNISNPPLLQLETDKESAAALVRLLQDGFYLPDVAAGTSVREFLTRVLGLDPEYIRNRIQSLFLDGKPVDDYDKAHVRDGSRLALSSALPGLVGATLRQGGLLASFRNTITYQETTAGTGGTSLVHVKLFNLIMDEMGPMLLQKGVLVKASVLRTFLTENQEVAGSSKKILLDSKPTDAASLLRNDFAGSDLVRISVLVS
ncbi:MAG TPA: hypothetical protein VK654_09525 [Nitrospirota bacterium]|nr:hypothetical protein [Nitrospirota bacterium]